VEADVLSEVILEASGHEVLACAAALAAAMSAVAVTRTTNSKTR
jgi:hypothetical protein